MNHYIMIRRLRGPVFLLLIGMLALLNQADILSWGKSWPLFLILSGILLLAERLALASAGGLPPTPRPDQSYPDTSASDTGTGIPAYPGRPVAQITDSKRNDEGGQL